MKHIVTVTYSDPSHEMMSMKGRTKSTNYMVEARNAPEAQLRASSYFRSMGYKIHSAVVNEQKAEAVPAVLKEEVEQIDEAGMDMTKTNAYQNAQTKAATKFYTTPIKPLAPYQAKTPRFPAVTVPDFGLGTNKPKTPSTQQRTPAPAKPAAPASERPAPAPARPAVPLVTVTARFATAACDGATERTPRPKAATATSAMRLNVVFVDICFLSVVELRTFRISA